jgi:hypothetical protein
MDIYPNSDSLTGLFHRFLLLCCFIGLLNCSEIPPYVTGAETVVSPPAEVQAQKRQVLVEEFTGVRCVNCPAGSLALEELKKLHGNQLVVVSIHAGEFSPPYPQSKYDFRTPEGNQLLDFLERPFGYPTAIINRRKFDGQFGLQLGLGNWAGYIQSEKLQEPPVKIELKADFDQSTRRLLLNTKIFFQNNTQPASTNLSVMLIENNIADLQLSPGNTLPKPDYIHHHVLRKMLTNYAGDLLTTSPAPGLVLEKSFDYVIPEAFKEKDLYAVVFVHQNTADKKVIQAHQTKISN